MVKIKTVNIRAMTPIKNVTPPIYGYKTNIKMELNDILKCLCKRAIIDEVLSDGSTVRLTMKNFREDFESKVEKKQSKHVSSKPVTKAAAPVEDKATEEQFPQDMVDDNIEPEQPNDPPAEPTGENGNTEFIPSQDDPANPVEETGKPDESTYVPEEDKVSEAPDVPRDTSKKSKKKNKK